MVGLVLNAVPGTMAIFSSLSSRVQNSGDVIPNFWMLGMA